MFGNLRLCHDQQVSSVFVRLYAEVLWQLAATAAQKQIQRRQPESHDAAC